jgi:tRNA 2-thiouridine synthesizing protein A
MERQDALHNARTWDAGETGCGQLIVGLGCQLGLLQCGESLRLVARDAGAPSDLAAWCRMTGHRLVFAEHPVYVIQKPLITA